MVGGATRLALPDHYIEGRDHLRLFHEACSKCGEFAFCLESIVLGHRKHKSIIGLVVEGHWLVGGATGLALPDHHIQGETSWEYFTRRVQSAPSLLSAWKVLYWASKNTKASLGL